VSNSIKRAIARWQSLGVPLNPPASAQDLAALAAFVGYSLPDALRGYDELADGMAKDETDDYLVHFWPIGRVLSEHDKRLGNDERGAYCDVAFADFLIDSWRFYLQLRSSAALSVYSEGGGPEVASLEEFFSFHLSEPCSISSHARRLTSGCSRPRPRRYFSSREDRSCY